MGERGPAGKRTSMRLGNLTKAELQAVTTLEMETAVQVPAPDPKWSDRARDWYISQCESGQSRFYEPSDWQTALVVGDIISLMSDPEFVTAALIGQLRGLLADLLSTESARRRANLEIVRKNAPVHEEVPALTEEELHDLYG